jgi:hypothetical protein
VVQGAIGDAALHVAEAATQADDQLYRAIAEKFLDKISMYGRSSGET